MTLRQLPRPRLAALLPPLTTSQAFVALVAATSDRTWAAEAAWSVARAAATGGRRVALVDLCLDDPILHGPIGDTADDGIVDAFEYGVSLSRVTREHLNGSLFFIPAGTPTAEPGGIFRNPRWTRLAAGFRQEGALLFAFLPPAALPQLVATPDAILVLAPHGFDPDSAPMPGLRAAMDAGVPLLGVVCDEAPREAAPSPRSPIALGERVAGRRARKAADRRRRARGALIAGGLAVAAFLVALAALELPERSGRSERPLRDTTPAREDPTQRQEASATPDREPAAIARDRGTRAPPQPFRSATPFVLQVAAHNLGEPARERAQELADRGMPTLVAPVALGSIGVWYRVYVGPFESERAAVDARAAVWNARLVRRGEGMVRRAPWALELDPEAEAAAKRAELAPYRVEGRLLIGAFETPEQAAVAERLLTAAGIPFTLVERAGTRP